jgi:acetyltransferase-like isoleucine patch superfamily enzyme
MTIDAGLPHGQGLEHKTRLGPARRMLRLILSALDPRAYLHGFKILNFYNYSHVAPRRKVTFGKDVAVSPNVWFSEPERIFVGDHCHLGARCMLWAGPSHGRILIGRYALFGPEVMVTASNYRYNAGQPVTDQPMEEADVVIGDDVWLGARVIVLAGARIGDGCVVAAGAVVRGEFPPFSVLAGVPARIVDRRRPGPATPGSGLGAGAAR